MSPPGASCGLSAGDADTDCLALAAGMGVDAGPLLNATRRRTADLAAVLLGEGSAVSGAAPPGGVQRLRGYCARP